MITIFLIMVSVIAGSSGQLTALAACGNQKVVQDRLLMQCESGKRDLGNPRGEVVTDSSDKPKQYNPYRNLVAKAKGDLAVRLGIDETRIGLLEVK